MSIVWLKLEFSFVVLKYRESNSMTLMPAPRLVERKIQKSLRFRNVNINYNKLSLIFALQRFVARHIRLPMQVDVCEHGYFTLLLFYIQDYGPMVCMRGLCYISILSKRCVGILN